MILQNKHRSLRLSRVAILCIIIVVVFITAVISFLATVWIRPLPTIDVPNFPFKHYGLQVKRIIHCYNPPGLKGEGPVLATYQLEDFDINAWIQQANKTAGLKNHNPNDIHWIRGPINAPRYLATFEYALSREAVGDQGNGYPWHNWVQSSKCYFSFYEMNGHHTATGKWEYADVGIWVLDAVNKRMYLVGRFR